MAREEYGRDQRASQGDQPWQGEWPGTGPAPSQAERETVAREMREGKWSEQRQRGDWTGEHHNDDEDASAQAASDVRDQVAEGSDEAS